MREFEIKNKNIYYKFFLKDNLSNEFPSIKKILKGNINDVKSKLNGIYELLKYTEIKTYSEICCGVGFSSSLIKIIMNTPLMKLNDISQICLDSLILNINETVEISNYDFYDKECFNFLNNSDLMFMDFSNFTLNHLDKYPFKQYLNTARKILVTDVFPFSQKPFNFTLFKKYILRYNNIHKRRSKHVESVFIYKNTNVCLILLSEYKSKSIKYIFETSNFTIKEILGLFKTQIH